MLPTAGASPFSRGWGIPGVMAAALWLGADSTRPCASLPLLPLRPASGAIPALCPDRAKPASDSHSLAFSPPPALLSSSLCVRGYLGPPHQGAPMHHMPGHDSRGPPHEMRGGPMGEPRPLMGEPRGPLMDARGERGGMK